MPNKDITSLNLLSANEISSDDIFLGTIPNEQNYQLSTDTLVDYFKRFSPTLFPVNYSEAFIQFNNTNSSVNLQNKDFSTVSDITFDQYGQIINLGENSNTKNYRLDKFNFAVPVQQRDNFRGKGFIDRNSTFIPVDYMEFKDPEVYYASTDETQNIGYSKNFQRLFDVRYTGFSKSIIDMRVGRGDNSGSNESASVFKFFVYWGNTSYIQGNAIINANAGYRGATQTLMWNYSEVNVDGNTPYKGELNTKDNPIETYPEVKYDVSPEAAAVYNFESIIQIDSANRQIKKLPVPVFGPDTNRQTHSYTVTIESFA